MTLYDLEHWIKSKRTLASSPEVEEDLPEWPEWRGRCPGISDYVSKLGNEFTRLCGADVQKKFDELETCADDLSTPWNVLRAAQKCTSAGGGIAGIWAGLSKCTLTSYIVASDMTVQERDDWVSFINGLDDIGSLVKLSETFQNVDINALGEVATQKPHEQVLDRVEEIAKVKKVPEHVSSIEKAILTIPTFKRDAIRRDRDRAVELLNSCRIEEAKDLYTVAQMELYRLIGSLRASLVLAEEQFYCMAKANDFETMSIANQSVVLQGYANRVANGYSVKRSPWKNANATHKRALRAYERLIKHPALSEREFRKWENRRAARDAQLSEIVEVANACVESCAETVEDTPPPGVPLAPLLLPPGVSEAIGITVGGAGPKMCTHRPETLQEALRAYAKTPCGKASLAEKYDVEELDRRLELAMTARARAKEPTERYKKNVEALLGTCDLDEGKIQSVKTRLEKRRLSAQRAYGFDCYGKTIEEVNEMIAARRDKCAAEEPRVDEVYFVINVTGGGFTPYFGGSYVLSGAHEDVITLKRDQDLQAKLEEILAGYDEDICDIGVGVYPHKKSTPPAIWNAGPQITVTEGPFTSKTDAAKAADLDTWQSTSSEGPPLDELKEAAGCG